MKESNREAGIILRSPPLQRQGQIVTLQKQLIEVHNRLFSDYKNNKKSLGIYTCRICGVFCD